MVEVGLEQAEYTVDEEDGFLTVFATLNGTTERSVVVTITTEVGTAS